MRPTSIASKGDDYHSKDATHPTYGITVSNMWQDVRRDWQPHGNVIEVYRDEILRDRVLHLLQTHGVSDQPAGETVESRFRSALEIIAATEPRSASAIIARAALAGRPF